jgi:hypothetical protein
MNSPAKTNNPDSKIFYKHLALASWRGRYDPKIRVGAFLPLQWSQELTKIESIEAMLDGKQKRNGLGEKEKKAIQGMLLRSKYADDLIGGGLLLFNAKSKMDKGLLEAYLNSLSPEELEEEIHEARMF